MDTVQTLSVGTRLLNGLYTIVRVLGRGGFGITYLAIHESLGIKVAIKEFFPRGMYNRESSTASVSIASRDNLALLTKLKAKFLKEARRLSTLKHESIVGVSNAFEENGTAYLVMDYIDGDDLNAIVEREGPLSLNRVLDYIRQIGLALEFLHGQRINHLDIKPANILVDRTSNRAILIDFGLSKQYDDRGFQTSTTPVGISAGYAPMEQYNLGGVKTFSAPTDIYSLGATLYYLLTGQRPPEATLLNDETLIFPPSIPDNVRDAIVKAMSPFRSARFQTVSEFMRVLSAKVSEKTIVIPTEKKSESGQSSSVKGCIFGFIFIIAMIIVTAKCVGSREKETENIDDYPVEVAAAEESTVADIALPEESATLYKPVEQESETMDVKREENIAFTQYKLGSGEINVPSILSYKGESEDGGPMFFDSSNQIRLFADYAPNQDLHLFKDWINMELGTGMTLIQKENYFVQTGYTLDNEVYYCKAYMDKNTNPPILYTAIMFYPTSRRNEIDGLLSKVFNSFPNIK